MKEHYSIDGTRRTMTVHAVMVGDAAQYFLPTITQAEALIQMLRRDAEFEGESIEFWRKSVVVSAGKGPMCKLLSDVLADVRAVQEEGGL